MAEFAAHPDAAARSITYVDPGEAASLNPAVHGDIAGGLHCGADAIVEPRSRARRTSELCLDARLVHVPPRPAVVAIEDHALVDTGGTRWEADLVVVATGAAFDHFARHRGGERTPAAGPPPDVRDRTVRRGAHHGVGRCRHAAVLPGLRGSATGPFGATEPLAAAHHLQLLLVQRADGGLTIGDTHAYEEPFDFALVEDPSLELLDRAGRLLGSTLPRVARRWEGVYAQCTDGAVCAREELAPTCGWSPALVGGA